MQLSEHLFRHESGRLVAALTRIFGVHNLALAEDVMQDAFCRALEVWKVTGIPDHPAAWLMTVAKRRALDIVRRDQTARTFAPEVSRMLESEWTLVPTIEHAFAMSSIRDEQLRMMFSCCHPRLPPDVQVALVPFGEEALRHFLYLERPDQVDVADAELFSRVCECRPLTATPATLMAEPQEYTTVGHLYRSISHGFARLVERYGEAEVFIGPPEAQATRELLGWPELVAVTDLASAEAAIATIVEQGEGADGDWREAHFGRLSGVLEEFLAATRADPSFEPARPAQPAYVRRPPDQPLATVISDPRTAQVAEVFDAAHQTLLQLLGRLFVHDEETGQEVDTLAGAAIGLMAAVLRPLGSVLTTLPLGPDHPGELAGPAFFMVHPSQFLLPWREAAWKVIVQRLGVMADACVRLGCEPRLERLAGLEEPVRNLAARLQAHLDERSA